MQVIAAAQAFLASASDHLRCCAPTRKACSTLCSATCWRASDLRGAALTRLRQACRHPHGVERSCAVSNHQDFCILRGLGVILRDARRSALLRMGVLRQLLVLDRHLLSLPGCGGGFSGGSHDSGITMTDIGQLSGGASPVMFFSGFLVVRGRSRGRKASPN